MMKISAKLMGALSSHSFDRFVIDRTRESGARISIAQPALSVEDARVVCEFVRGQASPFGFSSLAALACLVDLSYVLGPRMLSDASLPWVGAILSDDTIADDIVKANTLFANERRRRLQWYGAAGEKRPDILRSLVSLQRLDAIHGAVASLLPAKAAEAGRLGLTTFLEQSDDAAHRSAKVGRPLRIAVDFVLGVGWLEHPVGWALTGGRGHQPSDDDVVAAIAGLAS